MIPIEYEEATQYWMENFFKAHPKLNKICFIYE